MTLHIYDSVLHLYILYLPAFYQRRHTGGILVHMLVDIGSIYYFLFPTVLYGSVTYLTSELNILSPTPQAS